MARSGSRQWTTGGKPRLMGISKHGNKYLRKLLIHGARAALPHVAERNTPLGRWTKGLLARVICTSLDLIQRSMSDYVIHSTAGMIGEGIDVVKDASFARAGAAGAVHPDNIDPLAKLAAKR
jgi:transposase IS116/IS110/IS902 family protein